MGANVKGDPDVARFEGNTAEIDHTPHDGTVAQLLGKHEFRINAVLPADDVRSLTL